MSKRLLLSCFILSFSMLHAQQYDWAKSFGTPGSDYSYATAVDTLGNVYVTGMFSDTIDLNPGPATFNRIANGMTDVFIVKLDSTGKFLWGTSFGSIYNDYVYGIDTDDLGNVYTAGEYGGWTDFDPGIGVDSIYGYGGGDIFIHRMDSAGNYNWARTMGSVYTDKPNDIHVDHIGNVYVTGLFRNIIDADPGPLTRFISSAGGYDVFALKFNSVGQLIWAESFGGPMDDMGTAIIADDQGITTITGSFQGTADLWPGTGVENVTSAGSADVFIVQLGNFGGFMWAETFGNSATDFSEDIEFDLMGNILVAGYFIGTLDFDPDTSVYQVSSNSIDGYVLKVTSTGDFVWVKTIGGFQGQKVYDLAIDEDGSIYTAGTFTGLSDFDPSSGTYYINSTLDDAFIQKMTSNGDFLWANAISGPSSDVAFSIDVGKAKNVYTSGYYTFSADFDPSTSHDTLTSNGGYDAFLHKMSQCNTTGGVFTTTACSSYTWLNGVTYTSSNNTAVHVLPSANGCDSVVTLNLTITGASNGTDVITACDSYTWIDGNTYTTNNNTATVLLSNSSGCDSTVTLDLTITNSNTGTDVITACNSYTWIDGNTYTSSNSTATHTLLNAEGCDSVVTLNLTINNSNAGTDVVVACDSYTWIDGNTYTSSNTSATYTLQNMDGCDSVVTLNLTINNSNAGTDNITACDTYTWLDGVTYTANNATATHTLTNASGCDSVVTLNLTINSSSTGTEVVTACYSYTWIDGITYTTSTNSATHTLTNSVGCDSVVTLNLTIDRVSNITTTLNYLTITANNSNATYQWLNCDNNYALISGETGQSFTATADGNYAVELTENGCVDTSACVTISTVGLLENGSPLQVTTYPNPSTGVVHVEFTQTVTDVHFRITDVSGRVILTESHDRLDRTSFDLNEPPGVYLLSIRTSEGEETIRLVIE